MIISKWSEINSRWLFLKNIWLIIENLEYKELKYPLTYKSIVIEID